MFKNSAILRRLNQRLGSGAESVLDPYLLSCWIRIRKLNTDPDWDLSERWSPKLEISHQQTFEKLPAYPFFHDKIKKNCCTRNLKSTGT